MVHNKCRNNYLDMFCYNINILFTAKLVQNEEQLIIDWMVE